MHTQHDGDRKCQNTGEQKPAPAVMRTDGEGKHDLRDALRKKDRGDHDRQRHSPGERIEIDDKAADDLYEADRHTQKKPFHVVT